MNLRRFACHPPVTRFFHGVVFGLAPWLAASLVFAATDLSTLTTGANTAVTLSQSTDTAWTVNGDTMIGTLAYTHTNGTGFTLSGPGTTTLTFSHTSTPIWVTSSYFSINDYVSNLAIASSAGLTFTGKSNALIFQSGVSTAGVGASFTIAGSGGDGSMLYAQGDGVLPANATLVLNGGTGSNHYRYTKLVLNGGTTQTVGALSSTGAVANTYIAAWNGNSGLLTGGTVAGTNTTGTIAAATLRVGNDNGSATFGGIIGSGYTTGGVLTSDSATRAIHLVKLGTGTQTLTGANPYTGTTTVSQGTLLVNGTHDQGTGGNAGRVLVHAGATFGGTGTIQLSDTNGGTTGLSIAGTLSPGDPSANGGVGTLTIDGTASTRSAVAFEGGGTLHIRLNSGFAASKVALVGGQSPDVFFNNNVVNFTDMSGGGLGSGQYVLFSSDVAGAFSGLTTDGGGHVTAGLTIGTGLAAYTNTTLQVVGNNLVLNLVNPNEPVPVGLSFNVKGGGNTGMSPAETAGATGARFANWNNLDVVSGSGSIGNLVDSNGAAVTGVMVTLAAGNSGNPFSRGLANPSNDTRLFDTILDKFDGAAATVTVTGIPYGTYDVYFYMADDGSARGGSFTAGGTTYYLRGGAGTPTSGGAGYVRSTDTTFDSGADTQANYVKFTGLSGDLTATFTAVNQGDGVQRLKFPGFQIVGSAAPATAPPSAPAGVTITATGSTSNTLAWSPVNGATGYQIFRSTTSGDFDYNSPLASVAPPASGYTDATAVAGTTYYYVVRAVNGAGVGASSTEVGSPPPNLDSVTASSPVIWPGGSSTLSWAVPNADTLTIDSGDGPQSHATTDSLTVTPAASTTYTFRATNAHGTTTKAITVTIVPKPDTRDALWQWSVPLTDVVSSETNDHPRAFLYIPPGCERVRGVIIGQHNMLEEPVLEHTAVRQALADSGMAAIWVSPAFNGNFNFTANPNTPAIFQNMMDALAAESGYTELSKTPVVWIGHSAMAEAPYFFAAWDSQHSVATGEPKRCAAAISIKGWYPGKHDSTTPTYADSDLAGVPLLYIEGEYADANGRAGGTLNFRNNTAGSVVSFFADVGGGHFDWNDKVCESIGLYLRKIGQYRLPGSAAADGTATLQTINPGSQGWLADRWRKGQSPTSNPAAVGSYTGNASEAFWYFDQEHAESTHNSYLPVKTAYQLVGYTQNGALVPQQETHLQVEPAFAPDPAGDGLTFKLGTAFLDTVPATSSRLAGWTGLGVGSPIGHSDNGPILVSRVCGPVEQLSPDTFRIAFDRVGTNNIYGQTRSRDIVLMAGHPGDDQFVRAVQQSLWRIPLPLTAGALQTITFPAIADQPIGTTSVALAATTSGTATYAGAETGYYVREGPAKVNGGSLDLTAIPPRAKFPVKVTVVATQYGRAIAPLLQTATPVERTFFITASAVEQWRLQKFGTHRSSGDAADAADPDEDGRGNLIEYATGTDPLVAGHGPVQTVARSGDGQRLTLAFDRIADPALTYIVEASNDLAPGSWTTIWSSTGVSNAGGNVTVTDTELVSSHSRRFLRLRVTY